MLSGQEQQRLIDIERRLRASDPDLAKELSQGPLARATARQRAIAILATLSFRKRPRQSG
ncbi:DUF3040 domain-containing protein [Lentzea sp. CA-135723]|uniref:DUF3040 domain-containing protein n=1 Tax=Lentzea sp. CA-135723 TaxID=3239950 RepID=UPI003D9091B4